MKTAYPLHRFGEKRDAGERLSGNNETEQRQRRSDDGARKV
jgi:hypothetical protein